MQANFEQANLEIADLEKANLTYARLGKANLREANLKDTYLKGADLNDTYLAYADLSGAKNLTIGQLSKTQTLYRAQLDPELLEQVKKCCPHLLEKPKEDTDKKDKTK